MLIRNGKLYTTISNTPPLDCPINEPSISSVLHDECLVAMHDTELSDGLKKRLEKHPFLSRRNYCKALRNGCAPLFVAAKRGCVPIVNYLISVCNADTEQRGQFEVAEDNSVHSVTPVWCAAVSGSMAVLKELLRWTGRIDAPSDTGSTPVRSACFMTNLEVVRFLVSRGADIMKPNFNGGTCLINSVQSVPLCKFLISKGADVNAKDIQDKTALHYAIQEHRLETTKLLIKYGADPFARSRYGDDALQTACLKGANAIFDYLIFKVKYSPERLANAHELIGSTFLDESNETRMAIQHWRQAHEMRSQVEPYMPKLPAIPPRRAYANATEFTTGEQLENIELDVDAMRVQSLMICDRVLGLQHKDTLFRLMFRGAAYADSLRFQRCIELWQLALEMRVRRFSALYSDTCFTAQALVRLMLDLQDRHADVAANEFGDVGVPAFEDVAAVLELLAVEVMASAPLLQVRPVYKKQQENFDRVLRCITHLIHLALETATLPEQHDRLLAAVRPMVVANLRSACNEDSLLHLCTSRLNVIKSVYFADDGGAAKFVFPSVRVVRFLLAAGVQVNSVNQCRSTPLHVACSYYNYDATLVRMLIDAGAHIDQPNRNNARPAQLLTENPVNSIPTMQFMTLKCLAATAIGKYKIPYRDHVPPQLDAVIRLHRA